MAKAKDIIEGAAVTLSATVTAVWAEDDNVTIRLHGFGTPITIGAEFIDTVVNPKPSAAKPIKSRPKRDINDHF